jgi:hypothetical protein
VSIPRSRRSRSQRISKSRFCCFRFCVPPLQSPSGNNQMAITKGPGLFARTFRVVYSMFLVPFDAVENPASQQVQIFCYVSNLCIFLAPLRQAARAAVRSGGGADIQCPTEVSPLQIRHRRSKFLHRQGSLTTATALSSHLLE